MSTPPIKMRHEFMRIAGRKVDTKARIEVHYPYPDEVIGSVPAGTTEHAREAFDIAANYTPTLTRYERQKILLNVARIIDERKGELAPIILPRNWEYPSRTPFMNAAAPLMSTRWPDICAFLMMARYFLVI